MTAHLSTLGHDRPPEDLAQIRHHLQEARTREALANWRWQPGELISFLASGDARLIRDSAGLLAVLLEQLDQIQHDVRERAAFRSVWDGEPGTKGAEPKSEDTISDWLKRELERQLRPHVVVDREIQVTRHKDAGLGTRIDITATSAGVELGRVVFEAKLVDNSTLINAIDDQLVGQYMDPAKLTHGVYIVYWTAPGLRCPKDLGQRPKVEFG